MALSGLAASAQSFEPGYVVTRGDTLLGAVALGTEVQNGAGVRFLDPAGAELVYRPGEATAFGAWDGRQYRGASFRVRATPSQSADTPDVIDGFGRVLRDGPASLLAFEFIPGRPYYFLDLGDGLVPLLAVDRGANRNLYRQALLASFGACAAAPEVYAGLAYEERALVQEVDRYNACADPAYAAPTPTTRAVRLKPRVSVDLGLLGGTFERVSTVERVEPSVVAPSLRVEVAFPPVLLPAWAEITAEALYTNGLFRRVEFGGYQDKYAAIDAIHLGLGLRASVPVGTSRVQLGGGYLLGTHLFREQGAYPEDDPEVFRGVIERDIQSSGGPFASLGVAHPIGGRSLTAAVRVLRLVATYDRLFRPGTGYYRYGVTGAELRVGVRL